MAPLRLEIEERLVARIVEFASALQVDSLNPKPSTLAHPLDESDSGSFADLAAAFTPNATPVHTSGPGSVASGASTGHSEGVLTGAAGERCRLVLNGPLRASLRSTCVFYVVDEGRKPFALLECRKSRSSRGMPLSARSFCSIEQFTR